ncbi:hypothetical protein OAB57_01040 [Bacteriovoracaceae bacterium]|nr:hypothetical protein [Bacteriovoracaceae bacterium]
MCELLRLMKIFTGEIKKFEQKRGLLPQSKTIAIATLIAFNVVTSAFANNKKDVKQRDCQAQFDRTTRAILNMSLAASSTCYSANAQGDNLLDSMIKKMDTVKAKMNIKEERRFIRTIAGEINEDSNREFTELSNLFLMAKYVHRPNQISKITVGIEGLPPILKEDPTARFLELRDRPRSAGDRLFMLELVDKFEIPDSINDFVNFLKDIDDLSQRMNSCLIDGKLIKNLDELQDMLDYSIL